MSVVDGKLMICLKNISFHLSRDLWSEFSISLFILDEQIIRRRLQIDGEGVGDDRKINLLLKTYIRWCNSTDDKDDTSQHDRIITQLSHNEFSVLKSELSEQMIDEELKNYKKVSDNIAERIEFVKDQIDQSKKHLVSAKEIRRNKLEYSSLARLIKQEPDRKEIVTKHEILKDELLKKQEQFQKVNKVLDNRRKDFKSFMLITNQLLKDCNFDSNGTTQEMDMEDGSLDDEDDDIEKMLIEWN